MNKLNRIRTAIPTFFRALKSKDTPKGAKVAVILAILYAILPADVINDLLPFLGWFDDAIVMAVLFTMANKMIPEYVKEENKVEQLND